MYQIRNVSANLSFAMFHCRFVMEEVPCELRSQLSEIPVAMSKHLAHFWNSLLESQSFWTIFNKLNVIFSQTENNMFLKLKFSLKETFRNATLAPIIQGFKHCLCIYILFLQNVGIHLQDYTVWQPRGP